MHRNLKYFGFDGVIKDDADFIRLRNYFESLILKEMRESGYVPVLDLGSFFSTLWEDENKKYNFSLFLYGFYVGKAKSWVFEGWTNGKLIPKNIVKTK